MEVDRRIGLAIENAVAASRWRVMARFEDRTTAARFMRLADIRSGAATLLLAEIRGPTGRESRRPNAQQGQGG